MNAKLKSRILVVDDDAAVRTLLRECYELEGYEVTEARDGADLVKALAAGRFDLMTLDLSLGGESGLDIARDIRTRNNIPIIMITGKGDTIDRVVGLELGADDYITKPFHVREVLARTRAVLRRYEALPVTQSGSDAAVASPDSATRFWFDRWILDPARRDLRLENGEARELTTAEFNLLVLFVERPARVLSRDTIMDLLKGHEWSPFDRSIDSLIVRLRKKIERDPEVPHLIKTVRGVGYVFAAEVRKG
jgi:DNA-binding response OmpR family regulator